MHFPKSAQPYTNNPFFENTIHIIIIFESCICTTRIIALGVIITENPN